MSFRVVTYNILATCYINPNWYPGVPARLLDPAVRVPALVRHVARLGADVLCLQEVEHDVFRDLSGALAQQGLQGTYEPKGRDRPDGCATFFRPARFELIRTQRLDYHDDARERGVHSGHIALLLALRHENHVLGVANTHVRWDRPGTPREQQIGYREVAELVETCKQFEAPCRGWLICGDFNSTEDSSSVARLREAGFLPCHSAALGARSNVANGRAALIDYIFHTSALHALAIAPPEVADDTRLPSEDQPSDHVPLQADLAWQ